MGYDYSHRHREAPKHEHEAGFLPVFVLFLAIGTITFLAVLYTSVNHLRDEVAPQCVAESFIEPINCPTPTSVIEGN